MTWQDRLLIAILVVAAFLAPFLAALLSPPL